jgi:hypothetical protein
MQLNPFRWLDAKVEAFRADFARGFQIAAENKRPHVVEVMPPFVAVVLLAEIPSGDVAGVTGGARRVTLGASGFVREYRQMFEMHPNWPMRDGQVLVFADWQQIEVEGIFIGTDVLAFPSPHIGEFKYCELGKVVRVICRRREG